MRTFAARFAAAAMCLLFAHAAVLAQVGGDDRWVNGITEPWWFESNRYTAEQAAAARTLWERIGETEGDGWAGDYAVNMEVRAHFLRWSPKGFVFFNVNTCMSNVDEVSYGEAVTDSSFYFDVDTPRGSQRYVKVKWGEQRYLIEKDEVSAFCDYVAGFGEYNGPNLLGNAQFLSRLGDGERPTALLPTVPPEYKQYVRKPVDARLTRVGKAYVEVNPENEWWDELVTPVRLDAGSDQGLKRGMTLHALDSDEYDERVELTRVGRNYAHGIIIRNVRKRPGVKLTEWDDGKDEPRAPIAVGWRLTTSLYRWTLRNEARPSAEEAAQGKR
jgi:hypothetical protein